MECPRCQAGNRDGLKFCEDCGARLALACPQCGGEVTPGKKFCGSCGTAVVAQPAERFISPESYTPKHLAEKILTSKSALEGERKQVTVLFADLKGSMELLADRDPEEARKLLDPVLERMMEAVHHYEGTVNQVMGDGIMALFGAPLAHEDHAVRACYAALRMQETVGRYGDEIQRSRGVPVQIRVGLNSGEVVVRAIGSDLHMDYTAVGQTTHLAARVEQMAKPGSVLATADTLRLAEGFVQVTGLGPVPIKGLAEPVEVFELLGAGPTRTRWQAAAARGLTRFVGRQRELEALGQALERARAGHGQIVAPVGEPGVGKSRLFWEFTRSHRTHGWLVYETGSAPYGKTTPYFPIVHLLKTYFEIEPRDDARKIHAKVIGKLLTLDRAFESAVPAFLALLDIPVADPAWQALDPPQRRQRTLDAIKLMLLRESRVQPLLLAVEDLHWIDTETQAVLDTLVESLPTARILLLFNYRPEYRHGWGSKSYYTQLRIDPLPPENAGELLHALLGNDPGLDPLKQLLIDRTEGNPFFLEESVRTLVETKALMGERGAYRLAKDLPSVQVPATVQAVLAARIDRLPPEEKRLLQSASVIGRDVPLALLQAIGDLPEEAVRRGLVALQGAEFLYEKNLFPELEYTFKHALTHDVTYGSLLQDRRRTLHGQIVETIERRYPDRLAEHIERLAHHALRGELWDRAATYFGQAGTRAVARGASLEAVGSIEQALTALAHLPDSQESIERGLDLRLEIQSALLSLGEIERMLATVREAEPMAESLGDRRRLGRVTAHMARCFWWLGQPDQAVEAGERALAIASALDDLDVEVTASYILGLTHFISLGAYRRAIEVYRPTAERLTGDRVRERFGQPFLPAVAGRAFTGWCLAELGEFPAARAAVDEGVQIAEAVGQPYSLVVAYWGGVAHVHLVKGEFARALVWLERSLDLCRGENFAYLFGWVAWSLGQAYAYIGRVADGVALLRQAAEQSAAMKLMARYPRLLTQLGEAHLLARECDEALAVTRRAIELTRTHQQRGVEAEALRILGEIHATADPPDVAAAEAAYRAALALAEELGARPLVAHCHLGVGKLYHGTGDRVTAQEHLTSAASMYRQMDMAYWLEKAEVALNEFGSLPG